MENVNKFTKETKQFLRFASTSILNSTLRMSQIPLFKLKNSPPPSHRTDRRAILQSTTSNGCSQSAMRETKWHIKTTQRVSGRVLWNPGWRRSVCSTKLVYLGCNHVVCAYFALVCSSKLEHIFFGTAGYDLTWYTLGCPIFHFFLN